jgi:hypothetical protein
MGKSSDNAEGPGEGECQKHSRESVDIFTRKAFDEDVRRMKNALL